jgi:hypothetical protein
MRRMIPLASPVTELRIDILGPEAFPHYFGHLEPSYAGCHGIGE